MEKKFYFIKDEKKIGPFEIEELIKQGVEKDTLVWTEGLENWIKAEYHPYLKDYLNKLPPPIPKIEKKEEIKREIREDLKIEPSEEKKKDEKPLVNFGYKIATRRERTLAYIIESVIFFFILNQFYFNFEFSSFFYNLFHYNFNFPSPLIYGTLIRILLLSLMYYLWAGNLGHKIFGLKVISLKNGKDLKDPIKGIVREILKNISFLFPPIFIYSLFNDKKQNVYDLILDICVVKVDNQINFNK